MLKDESYTTFSDMRVDQLSISATRGQCYKTFLSVIYKLLF